MTIHTFQKLIKVGTSGGVTLPAKELKAMGVEYGEELEIFARKKLAVADDTEIQTIAAELLDQYDQDFKNLAKR